MATRYRIHSVGPEPGGVRVWIGTESSDRLSGVTLDPVAAARLISDLADALTVTMGGRPRR